VGAVSEEPIKPNATSFTVHRWFYGEDKQPTYQVTWENAWEWDGDDEGEQEQDFRTLEEAFEWCRTLLQNATEINLEGLAS
jgi:hypothetical protein